MKKRTVYEILKDIHKNRTVAFLAAIDEMVACEHTEEDLLKEKQFRNRIRNKTNTHHNILLK